MAISKQFVEYVIEQLQGLERLTSRRMFSGVGLYGDGLFFGLLYHERLYFKTDDTTRPEYEARGSEGFRPPRPNITRMKMSYYTVPADVLEDAEELVKWARQAKAVALASESAKAAKKAAGENSQRSKSRPTKEGQRAAGSRKVASAASPPTMGPVANNGPKARSGKVASAAPTATAGTAAPDGRRLAVPAAKRRAKATR
jgi:DNA transformation protein and related proteins